MTFKPAASRAQVYDEMLARVSHLRINERYYVLTPDERRMSREEAKRRVAMRRDRQNRIAAQDWCR
jgi:hypothetical protein